MALLVIGTFAGKITVTVEFDEYTHFFNFWRAAIQPLLSAFFQRRLSPPISETASGQSV